MQISVHVLLQALLNMESRMTTVLTVCMLMQLLDGRQLLLRVTSSVQHKTALRQKGVLNTLGHTC